MPLYPDDPTAHDAYPPFPWRMELADSAVVTLHLVDAARLEALVPREFHVVRVLPGKTVGGLYFATYGPGSDLAYNELIVIPALVMRAGRFYPWVSHIWVDHPASLAGGRTELGVPKELGRFSVEVTPAGRRVDVEGVATIEQARGRLTIPAWLAGASANLDVRDAAGGRAIAFQNAFKGRLGFARASVTLDPNGPLSGLGFHAPFASLWGRDVTGVLGGREGRAPKTFPVTPR